MESVKAINRGKKVKKINRLKTCAICKGFCTRFSVALQAQALAIDTGSTLYWSAQSA